MTKTLNTVLAATALLATASYAHADASYDQYRRVVLGDTRIAAPASLIAAAPGSVVVPGPYAQYLINTGASKPAAISGAARIGEQATTQAVAAAPQRKLTPAQAYAKFLGQTPRANDATGSAE